MALRRSQGQDGDKRLKGFADRIAAATKPEPSGSVKGEGSSVITPGLTRYQRRSANLPAGAKSLTAEEVSNIVIDLTDEAEVDEAPESEDAAPGPGSESDS
jgi:hypothetical protein